MDWPDLAVQFFACDLLYQLQEAQPDLDAAAAFIRRIAQ